MRRLVLIVNPKAQGVSRRHHSEVLQALEPGFVVRSAITRGRGHARELAAAAIREGADVVACYGGDGTVNEAANALVGTATPLTVVPGGGANIFARAIGLPWDAVAAARAIAAMPPDRARALPVGRIDDRSFVSNCGMGFDAAIVRAVERHPGIKRATGDWFFVWSGVRLFFLGGYDRRRPRIRLSTGEHPAAWRGGLYLTIVQNVDPFTYLGRRPLRICPDVAMDGALDAFAVDSMRARHILPVLFRAFGRAGHAGMPHVVSVRDQRRICLRADVPMPVQADGEYIGDRQEVVIESVPAALSVLA